MAHETCINFAEKLCPGHTAAINANRHVSQEVRLASMLRLAPQSPSFFTRPLLHSCCTTASAGDLLDSWILSTTVTVASFSPFYYVSIDSEHWHNYRTSSTKIPRSKQVLLTVGDRTAVGGHIPASEARSVPPSSTAAGWPCSRFGDPSPGKHTSRNQSLPFVCAPRRPITRPPHECEQK